MLLHRVGIGADIWGAPDGTATDKHAFVGAGSYSDFGGRDCTAAFFHADFCDSDTTDAGLAKLDADCGAISNFDPDAYPYQHRYANGAEFSNGYATAAD